MHCGSWKMLVCGKATVCERLFLHMPQLQRKSKIRVLCTVCDRWTERGWEEQSENERNTRGGVVIEEAQKETEREVWFPSFCSVRPVWHVWFAVLFHFAELGIKDVWGSAACLLSGPQKILMQHVFHTCFYKIIFKQFLQQKDYTKCGH